MIACAMGETAIISKSILIYHQCQRQQQQQQQPLQMT